VHGNVLHRRQSIGVQWPRCPDTPVFRHVMSNTCGHPQNFSPPDRYYVIAFYCSQNELFPTSNWHFDPQNTHTFPDYFSMPERAKAHL